MVQNLKVVLSRHIFLKDFDTLVFKFENGAAFCTYQVVVVRVRVGMFIAGKTIIKPSFLSQTCIGKQL